MEGSNGCNVIAFMTQIGDYACTLPHEELPALISAQTGLRWSFVEREQDIISGALAEEWCVLSTEEYIEGPTITITIPWALEREECETGGEVGQRGT
jgi:hypothetical protein